MTDSLHTLLADFHREQIMFPPYVAAFEEILRLMSQHRQTGLAEHLLILGESGTGKTSLCNALVAKHPRFSLPDRDMIPVLHVPIPAAATIGSATEAMLKRLGDPAPHVGSNSAKTARAITLAQNLGVELLIFDEAQHIHDRGQQRTQYAVGDWFKSLIDEINVPTVLIGLPRTELILQVNEQLRRRFSLCRSLHLGQDEDTPIDTECLQLFVSLGRTLPYQLVCGDVGWSELGHRLYFGSDGRVGYVKKLMVSAMRLAHMRELREISPAVLEEAFAREVWRDGVGKLNPFNTNFVFRRLDRYNEPFADGQGLVPPRYREARR